MEEARGCGMSKDHRLKARKPTQPTKPMPLNFLLGCEQSSLTNFELARLAEVADLRKELHAILDRAIDAMTQAALASWFKSQDRQSLKAAIENEESPIEYAKRMTRDGQRSPEELLPLPAMEPGSAHRAAALRYQTRNIAEGKCSVCPKPLDRNSVRYCTKHLAKMRARKGPKGQPGEREYLYGEGFEDRRGRTPTNLAAMAMGREQRTRALLAELGVKPENAAVGFNAAIEALARIMPRKKSEAMTQTELFEKAGIVTAKTGQKALAELLAARTIERIGKGGPRDLYRYWRKQ